MEKWVVRSKSADFAAMMDKHNISEVMARLLANRNVIEDDDIDKFLNLNPSIEGLYDPKALKDIDFKEYILDGNKEEFINLLSKGIIA